MNVLCSISMIIDVRWLYELLGKIFEHFFASPRCITLSLAPGLQHPDALPQVSQQVQTLLRKYYTDLQNIDLQRLLIQHNIDKPAFFAEVVLHFAGKTFKDTP